MVECVTILRATLIKTHEYGYTFHLENPLPYNSLRMCNNYSLQLTLNQASTEKKVSCNVAKGQSYELFKILN